MKKQIIYYIIAALTSLFVTFILPQGINAENQNVSWSEIFFALSSIMFLSFFLYYAILEARKDTPTEYKDYN